MSNSPILELTKWRVRTLLREPEAIFWIFVFPIILALALGIAFRDRPVGKVRVAVEAGAGAEGLVRELTASPRLTAVVLDPKAARIALRAGRVPVVVVPGTPVTMRYDSTREESIVGRFLVDDALQRAEGRQDVRSIRAVHTTEPGARYIDFLLPGLLGMNIMGTGIWGVGFGVVRTRHQKLLKRFAASPMRRSHYLLSQLLARLGFLVLEVVTLIGFGVLVFHVPFVGSIGTFAVAVVAGALAFGALGLLVGSRVRTIEGASGLMNVVMMPMWILSGVFFSASRFPDAVQPAIRLLPLTALNDALRGVMLDGATLPTVGWALVVLAVWTAGTFGLALKVFRWD